MRKFTKLAFGAEMASNSSDSAFYVTSYTLVAFLTRADVFPFGLDNVLVLVDVTYSTNKRAYNVINPI